MSPTRTIIRAILFVCITCMIAAAPAEAASRARKKGVKRIKRARKYFDEIMEAPDTAIPQTVLQNCRGIIVVRQYKAGFVLGAKGGAGLAMLKDKATKKWSPPVFIKTGEGSIGFQIGGQSIDSIFLIMNKEGVEMLLKSKFKIGVDASAAAGPVGRDAEAKIGAGTAILVYARAKGLYVGATFEGGLLLLDGTINEAFYGKGNTRVADILAGRVRMPREVLPLIEDLKKYAGENKPKSRPQPAAPSRQPGMNNKTEKQKRAARKTPAADKSDADNKKPQNRETGANNQPTDAALLKELNRLKNLHDKKLITDKEYQEMKRKVLDKHFK